MSNLRLASPGVAVAFVAMALLGMACASGQATREPRLTNPPRYDRWLGDDADVALAAADEELQFLTLESYSGSLRLPLSEDWRWQMPDRGIWSISRLELSSAVVHEELVLIGNSRSPGLFVLERSTGRQLQTIAMEGPVQAPPVRLPDGWLVVDVFGNLQRFRDDLSAVWKQAYACGGAVFRSPVVDGDQVLVATSNDVLIAVSLADGSWRWNHKRSVPRGQQELAILGAPAPVVFGDEVLQGFSDGYVVGIDRKDGRELWAVSVGDGKFPDIQSEVIVHDQLLIAAAFGGPVTAIDARTHSIRWRNDDAGAVSTMVFAGDSLYTSDDRGRLHSIDPESGASQWLWEPRETQLGPAIRSGSILLVGDASGTLYAVDRYEGKELWRYRPADGSRLSGVAAAATVEGRQLLFVSAGGQLHSLIAPARSASDLREEPGHRHDRRLGW